MPRTPKAPELLSFQTQAPNKNTTDWFVISHRRILCHWSVMAVSGLWGRFFVVLSYVRDQLHLQSFSLGTLPVASVRSARWRTSAVCPTWTTGDCPFCRNSSTPPVRASPSSTTNWKVWRLVVACKVISPNRRQTQTYTVYVRSYHHCKRQAQTYGG